MGSQRVLSTTNTSLRVIDTIIQLDGATLSEITDEMEMARSAIHNHLQTLIDNGYVVKDEQFYRVGLKLVHLGEYAKSQRETHTLANKWVLRLAKRTELETDFAVEENGRIISLYDSTKYTTESTGFIDSGRYFYSHNTAAGKAILSHYTDDYVNEILNKWGMPSDTENSITSRPLFFDELGDVRKQGYAISLEECIKSLHSVACAVQTPRDQVCGAFVISGPPYVLDDRRIKEATNSLKQVAQQYEEELAQFFNVS